jgi:serine/threonine protein kinase
LIRTLFSFQPIPSVDIELYNVGNGQRCTDESLNYNRLVKYEFPVDKMWEVPRDNLTLGKVLGIGKFGKIVMAEAKGLNKDNADEKNSSTTTVAVKMLKQSFKDTELKSLVCEMEIMKKIGQHANLINLLGCCKVENNLLVLVEFAEHGDLLNYLRKHKPTVATENSQNKNCKELTYQDQLSFSSQIAKGMQYLSEHQVGFCTNTLAFPNLR